MKATEETFSALLFTVEPRYNERYSLSSHSKIDGTEPRYDTTANPSGFRCYVLLRINIITFESVYDIRDIRDDQLNESHRTAPFSIAISFNNISIFGFLRSLLLAFPDSSC